MAFQPKWASAPGTTIKEVLADKNISENAFAERIGQPRTFVSRLLRGHEPITGKLAQQLSGCLGASSDFWIHREDQYREDLARIEAGAWLAQLPIKDMIKFGWIDKSKDLLNGCLEYFGVDSVGKWNETYDRLNVQGSFRTSYKISSKFGSVSTWIRQGELEAGKIDCLPWNSDKFVESLPAIRELTRIKDPRIFIPKLRTLCAASGVALAIVKTPSGCTASGMTKFLTKEKALLMLSFRFLSDDQFWFTFFHEAGHLILHGQNEVYLEDKELNNANVEQREIEANSFSSEMLIPHRYHTQLRKLKGKWNISRFASNLGVSTGIVVGQMQYYRFVEMNQLNGYKRRFNWDQVDSVIFHNN
ncbi:ImmA/IrrE family metallo-endopeptidase [Dyadobacter sediminis]|uniref:ImmA/IrrE family metallo-endopeptidase n=1 Tax=Dyadobacter sediminis TaxID=1493691 RepID=A0A5R9KGR4_9BACT|nr:ImmA/IrrE family metallo-endopeptidase [Dyadobacter sediminis]TLU95292.1 ImmA/IrrE family metallo-endopeptidase [Dyadobacter sediminis]GGC16238.1 XRE family transcriptional regulator [Dyadobacter sediminis]